MVLRAHISLSVFGYTGENYGDSTQLTYLRSRFYASNTGRFLTRDTWMGNYNRPLSLNRWMYVEGNLVNFTDPNGHSPVCDNGDWDHCDKPSWWKKRSHIYVEGYGYFDTGHLRRGWESAEYIYEKFGDVIEKGGEIPLNSKSGNPPKVVYAATYYVSKEVQKLSHAQQFGVMYGIYTDFERGYEEYQKHSWSFYSAYSPEDLPSDHLGFWAYMHGLEKDDIPFLLECLGTVTDRGDSPLGSLVVDVYSDGTHTGFSYPRNYEFLPMVTETVDYGNGVYATKSRNIPWPTQFEIQAVSSGPNTWQKVFEWHK